MSTCGSSQIEMDDNVSIVAPPSIVSNEGKNLTVIDTMRFGMVLLSVASWAVFPPNWAGFDTKLRKNFRVCGLRFLGLLLV